MSFAAEPVLRVRDLAVGFDTHAGLLRAVVARRFGLVHCAKLHDGGVRSQSSNSEKMRATGMAVLRWSRDDHLNRRSQQFIRAQSSSSSSLSCATMTSVEATI